MYVCVWYIYVICRYKTNVVKERQSRKQFFEPYEPKNTDRKLNRKNPKNKYMEIYWLFNSTSLKSMIPCRMYTTNGYCSKYI